MPKLIIEGQNTLTGTIKVSGAKNSVVALIPAILFLLFLGVHSID